MGAAAPWPVGAYAQKATPVVGFLSSASPDKYAPFVTAFREGLAATGFIEGENVALEYGWADNHYDRLPGLATDLVNRKVDVIVSSGGAISAAAAKAATSTIPIVFSVGDDPVSAGLVASFSRPGGNLTGVSFFVIELGAKLFDLASELVPAAVPIAALVNPNRPTYSTARKAIEDAARAKTRALIILDAANEKEFEPAFAALTQMQVGALVVTSDPLLLDRRERLVALAAQHATPAIYAWRSYVALGGLMSYGIDLRDVYRMVGGYAGKILRGRRPADLPIERPTKFELVINLKTANALGLTVPQLLLRRADEVIE